MNIFEDYLIKIENTIKKANKENLLELPENLSGINVDIPPAKFNGDVSTNVAMVLSKINKINHVYLSKNKIVNFSTKFASIEKEIKNFLRINMYNNKNVQIKNNNGKKIVKHLFKLIERNPKKFIKNKYINNDKYRSISDYISGMTDRYAIQLYKMSK